MRLAAVGLALLLAAFGAAAERTVCSITVNSADEKEAFRRHLPAERYRFLELVERGRADWMRSACEKKVECDVLIISGHFNAGDAFYSDRLDSSDYLRVDELERASCSDSCPGLFAHLKEVYLFGCESLNPDASKYASSHGDSGDARMRRIFAGVPVIYGFPLTAPAGPAAAALLERYFAGGTGEIASGRRSARLLELFSRNAMVAIQGVPETHAGRAEICRFFDERLDAAQKLAFIHATMRRDMARASFYFARIDGLLAGLTEAERGSSGFLQALAEISADDATRASFLAAAHATADPALRARMVALAANLGWLDAQQETAEIVATVNAVLAGPPVGFAEVSAVCALNASRRLDREIDRFRVADSRRADAGVSATLACLGDSDARTRVLAALASSDERDVQVAQAYLRHRPVTDPAEQLAMARNIARMPGVAAKVRALDTFGRLYTGDPAVADELMRAFVATPSAEVQRAIAEVFLRAGAKAMAASDLASALRRHRLASKGGKDVIDDLIRRLTAENASDR